MSHVTLASVPHPRRGAGARVLTVAVAFAMLTACGAGDSPADVEDSYGEYRQAVSDKDGAASADRVSAATLRYYAGLRDLALTADRATLAKQRVVDQLAVLSIRALIPVAELRGARPEQVVAAAVDRGVINEGGEGISALTKVEVSGDTAAGQLSTGGQGQPAVLISFRQEDDVWKIDLTSLLEPAETALSQAAKNQDLDPQALLERVMTTRVGEAKARTLWQPLSG